MNLVDGDKEKNFAEIGPRSLGMMLPPMTLKMPGQKGFSCMLEAFWCIKQLSCLRSLRVKSITKGFYS